MPLVPDSRVRNVTGLDPKEKTKAMAYIQGLVYSWVRDRPGEVFAARDVVGGVNADWRGTPLIILYDKHIRLGKSHESAMKAAAKDFGWLLKAVLAADKRHFAREEAGRSAGYRWIGNEP